MTARSRHQPVVVGVDVGGTTIAVGMVTHEGEVLAQTRAPTHRDGPGTAVATLEALTAAMLDEAARRGVGVAGVGVGVPGPVDAATGTVGELVPHAPELAGQPLASRLRARFGVPAFIDNDVNALALGEWMFGAGRGARSLVVLAAGTGLGAGIVLEGALVRGASGFGGELGHTPVKFDGPRCWCGGRGCLALYASGRGLAEAARAEARREPGGRLLAAAGGDPQAITAALVFAEAAAGGPLAVALVEQACQTLGAMLGTIVNGLNPEVIVVTGGVAVSLVPLEKRILGWASEYAFARPLAATRIAIVPGDKGVSMRGAAAVVRYEQGRARGSEPTAAGGAGR
jgi:glucokinase